MPGDNDQNPEPDWLLNLPTRSNDIGFAPEELVQCMVCGKRNAPHRTSCLYCGDAIAAGEIERLDARELESWENGFNVILLDSAQAEVETAAKQIASILDKERDVVASLLESNRPVPLCRLESEAKASLLGAKLEALGVMTTVVSDESLKVKSPPSRLRSLRFENESLTLELFNSGEKIDLRRDEIALIIPGVFTEDRTESIGKRKRKSTKTVQEIDTSSDQPVIDIYSAHDPNGWRIPGTGFDFSCLGADKSLIVAENMKELEVKLAQFAPSARMIDDYKRLRSSLEVAWPSESRRDSQLSGVGLRQISNVFTTNNSGQFTKFSRLQWRLYEKEV
jgi:ribosomal protein L32